ncbi:MAG TPA: AI-2E family transporter [Stenomitos sp.]
MIGNLSSRSLLWAVLYVALAVVTYFLLNPFWEALAWSLILAAVTWPGYRRLRGALKGKDTASAVVMSLLVVAAVAVPVTFIAASLLREVGPAFNSVMHLLASPPPPPGWLQRFPALVTSYDDALEALRNGSGIGRQWIVSLAKPGTRLLAAAGDTLLQGAIALFTLFFLYRNGDRYRTQAKAVFTHLLGPSVGRLVPPTKEAMRAVFAGVILAAVAQGVTAGIGFLIVGLHAPILLGVATAIMALIPFGAVLIWGTAGAWLIATGSLVKGIILLAWGALAVSSVDNLVRPLVISGTTRLPYLQVFFAFLGGLATFGLVGLFIGPAILAVWMVLWHEWAAEGAAQPAGPADLDTQATGG